MSAGRLLIILGIVLVVLGMLWPLVTRLGLGRLTGRPPGGLAAD